MDFSNPMEILCNSVREGQQEKNYDFSLTLFYRRGEGGREQFTMIPKILYNVKQNQKSFYRWNRIEKSTYSIRMRSKKKGEEEDSSGRKRKETNKDKRFFETKSEKSKNRNGILSEKLLSSKERNGIKEIRMRSLK